MFRPLSAAGFYSTWSSCQTVLTGTCFSPPSLQKTLCLWRRRRKRRRRALCSPLSSFLGCQVSFLFLPPLSSFVTLFFPLQFPLLAAHQTKPLPWWRDASWPLFNNPLLQAVLSLVALVTFPLLQQRILFFFFLWPVACSVFSLLVSFRAGCNHPCAAHQAKYAAPAADK